MNRAQRRAQEHEHRAQTPNGPATVVAGFLHRQDSTSPKFLHSFTMLAVMEANAGRLLGFFDEESTANISAARNRLVRKFLEHPAAPDWLLMLDDDMTFGTFLLAQLLEVADVDERPIVGGLCFSVGAVEDTLDPDTLSTDLELKPTLFRLTDDGVERLNDYPRDAVIQVHSTGAACVLIHRRVLADERWHDDDHPFPWFRESTLFGKPCSEDQRFFLRAGQLGYPVVVNTAAKTGHHKSFIADERMYDAQRATTAPALEVVEYHAEV